MASMTWDEILDKIAKAGYERVYDNKWDDLPLNSIDRDMWHNVARAMIAKLWKLYQADTVSHNNT